MEEVYRSDTIVVRRVASEDVSRWVITFDNHGIGAGFDRHGFGETFLRNEGISAIHVLGRGNDWYNYPDVMDAARAVRRATAGARRRLAYGSSMGGFAALRLADAVRASRVLALSPQYSIDPARVPWETRWEQDSHRIDFQPAFAEPLKRSRRALVVYDPIGDDRRHADLIVAETGGERLAIPYAGHPVSTFLQETGLLRKLVLDLLDHDYDARRYLRRVRRHRRRSAAYLGNLAERQPPSRPRTAIALAHMAAGRGGALGLLSLGRITGRTGDPDGALHHLKRAVRLADRDPNYLVPYADGLFAAGDTAGAIEIALEAVESLPEMAHLRHWLAWLHVQAGDFPAAIAQERRALALFPGNAIYADALARIEALAQRGPAERALRRGLATRWRAVRDFFASRS